MQQEHTAHGPSACNGNTCKLTVFSFSDFTDSLEHTGGGDYPDKSCPAITYDGTPCYNAMRRNLFLLRPRIWAKIAG